MDNNNFLYPSFLELNIPKPFEFRVFKSTQSKLSPSYVIIIKKYNKKCC